MGKTTKNPSEKISKDIKPTTRRHYSAEEKIRISNTIRRAHSF